MPPLWFPLTLLAAVLWAGGDALCKRALRDHPSRAVAGARWWYALPFLAVPLLWTPVPRLDATFWLVVCVAGPLEVLAMFLYLRAIGTAPLSLTAPLLAWTPVFSALFSLLILHEVPSPAGGLGVVLVAAGSWMLYSREGCSALEPLACLARARGARLVLVVAVIYSVTSALGKIGMRHSSPAFFGVAYVGLLALCLAAVSLARGEGGAALRELRPTPLFFLIGAVVAGMTFLHFTAIGMTNVAYMVAVKRTSLLVSVVFGRVFFGEAGLRRRLPGAALMLAGVLLLGLGG